MTREEVVRHIFKAITVHIGPQYIRLPFTELKAEELITWYYRNHSMLQCLGLISGTHIEIKQSPTNSMAYINRKGRFMLNVQVACYCLYELFDDWIK